MIEIAAVVVWAVLLTAFDAVSVPVITDTCALVVVVVLVSIP